ncbi:MAG: hypothetical protein JWN40_5875 [Phycisphaerales bacterium]|nr:hypothetical protein [Phycisphaerales bacterium]
MNVRKVNLGLWTLAAGLAAGAIVCAGLGVLTPVEVDSDSRGIGRRAAATSQGSVDSQLSLAEFEPIWRLSLRKSLSDAPVTAPISEMTATPAGPGGPFVLIGTIGDSLAMIRTSSGIVEIKGLGELANGAKIVAIRTAQVDVEVAGQRLTIAKLREGSGG